MMVLLVMGPGGGSSDGFRRNQGMMIYRAIPNDLGDVIHDEVDRSLEEPFEPSEQAPEIAEIRRLSGEHVIDHPVKGGRKPALHELGDGGDDFARHFFAEPERLQSGGEFFHGARVGEIAGGGKEESAVIMDWMIMVS